MILLNRFMDMEKENIDLNSNVGALGGKNLEENKGR
jgi:hypothetical protein